MKIRYFLVIACATVFFSSAKAQWKSDATVNTPVCTALTNQQNPQACDDGTGGVIIVWEDFRKGHESIFAQKLDANGVAVWAKDGIIVCDTSASLNTPIICSDGNKGAYIVWKDLRTANSNGTDLYAQHVDSSGKLVYGKYGSGIAVAKDVSAPDNVTICADGFGSAYVAWQDGRSSISPASTRPEIYMNRLNANGVAWGSGGTQVITQALAQNTPVICPDGTGGCFLAWASNAVPAASIWANRINQGGGAMWGSPGIQVFGVTGGSTNASRNPAVARDGNQLCIAWEYDNSTNSSKGWNILANRVTANGALVWGTSTSAPEISSDWVGDQINAIVFPDDSTDVSGVGGLLVVYENYFSSRDIVMTRLLPDGNSLRPSYPNQLYSVCSEANDQTGQRAVKTGSGELLTVWNDTRNTYSSIYAQRTDRTPKRQLTSSGVAVSNHANTNADQVTLAPRTNGGIAAWRDSRNGATNTDIYAQLIFRDGSLPVELSDFSLRAQQSGNVLVHWETASEKDNAGFEIERRLINEETSSNTYEVISSYLSNANLRSSGFSNTPKNYSLIDNPGAAGIYEYRLVDYSLDGERTVHEPKTIAVSENSSGEISIGTNSPNPFSEKTLIPISLPSECKVTVHICDILGRTIATPYENSTFTAGTHQLNIPGSWFINPGRYYYIVSIADPETGNIFYTGRQSLVFRR